MAAQSQPEWQRRVHTVRGIMGCCHVLADDDGVVLLDTGLIGEPWFIRRCLRRLGLGEDPAAAILVQGKLALSPGPGFGRQGAGFARLNFGTSPAFVEEAVARLARARSD